MSDNLQPSGVPTTTSDVPNELPDPSSSQSPSLFSQAMQGSVQPPANTTPQPALNGPGPSPSNDRYNSLVAYNNPVSPNPATGGPQVNPGNGRPPKPLYHDQADSDTNDPRDFHPAVQQASILRRVAQTLAGGPRVQTTIDSQTGERKETPVPLTSKQIMIGAVANILGGVGQVASNLSNRMAGRAPNPIKPLPTQQAQQDQAQQSEEDYNRQENAKVRQAKIINANMEAARTAFALGKEDDDAKDSVIQNHAGDLENWEKAGAVEASNIPSDELLKKGFDKTKYVAIPDGRVPVFTPDGKRATNANGIPLSQLTYSVVDGTTQAPLTQDKYNQLAKYGLMSTREGFKLPEGASISSAQLALMNHKLDLIGQTQRELDEVHGAVGGEKVDLADQIKRNQQMLSAIEMFHNDGASTEPDNQINNLQNSQNPKAKQAAGLMRELFGNDTLEKYKEARTTRQEQQKLQLASDITLKREKDLAAFKQKIGASDGSDSVSNAKSYPNEWVDAKTGMHYNLSDPIYNMVEGGQDPSQLTKRSKNYDANLRRANDYSFARYGKPFDAAKAQEDYKYANQKSTQDTLRLLQSLTGDNNNSGGTLAQLQSQFDALRNTPIPKLNELENWMSKNAGRPEVTNFGATLLGVSDEMGKILGGGVATDSSRNEAREILDKAFSGSQGKGAISAVRGTLANRQNALVANNRYLTKQFGQMSVPGQTISVSAPNGKVYHFKDQAAADNFKKQADIQ